MPKRAIVDIPRKVDISLSSSFVLDDATGKKAVVLDASGATLVFKGTGFDYEGGLLTSGTVTSMQLYNERGLLVTDIHDFKVNAGSLAASDMFGFYVALATRVYSQGVVVNGSKADDLMSGFDGDDIMKGGKGDDTFNSRGGNDVLTGGPGNDMFFFSNGYRQDTITDFDANGGPGHQDFIVGSYPGDDAIVQWGKHDTLIDFGHGDLLLLLNVRASQITQDDFM